MSDANLLIDPLPTGWQNCRFGDICDRVKESHQPVEGGQTPYVGLEHLAQGLPAFVGRGTESDVQMRVLEWAVKLHVPMKNLTIRSMNTKWASCSTSGNLTFNAELLALDREIGDYVIVHELLHFSVPNHGRLWKSLMRVHLGDYERIEERLEGAGRCSKG